VAVQREPVGRSLEVLLWMADHPSSRLGVRQIARDLDTSPATVHRILRTFEQYQLVARTEEGEYTPGLELYRICASIAKQISPANIARPHLENLAQESGEATLFAIYEATRQEMMFIDKVEASHPLRYVIDLNQWMPVHAGATGLAILAFLPDEERQRLYSKGLGALTPLTKVSEAELEAEVATIRAQGFAQSRGQRMRGAVGFAAPVFDSLGQVCGDLCITLPEQRFDPDRSVDALALPLKAASQRITDGLRAAGYQASSPNTVDDGELTRDRASTRSRPREVRR
jgi:IclR family acetate operon transcriptional repressor